MMNQVSRFHAEIALMLNHTITSLIQEHLKTIHDVNVELAVTETT